MASSPSVTFDFSGPPPIAFKTYSLFQSSSQTSSIKLDRMNYLVWASVALPLIEGNRLQSHIDATALVPSMTVALSTTKEAIPNPEFDDWFSVDRMLIGWLRNMMSQDIMTQLLHCRTALELWSEARTLTSAISKS
ncbi:hypothetical protein QN277_009475 [Acacia crassicarpa]|uniref:Retrotransposon Copia-like N-terminal domain-containing protein n=1 Tax=Acacia crassicarpa TaxID=499986 RepID=A0AAE1IP58_9FABA|nr:hypothetical protein QN277_009475 [Acacia crassicarpa]